MSKEYYDGPPLENGKSSIKAGVCPAVKMLTYSPSGMYRLEGKRILDYGAGKYARNADWLRRYCKAEVYAYDPFNGTDCDGWLEGNVSIHLPDTTKNYFNYAFTSYVLNIVPKYMQDRIVKDLLYYSNTTFHIGRDSKQIIKEAHKFMQTTGYDKFKESSGFKLDVAFSEEQALSIFGFPTSKGFQRTISRVDLSQNDNDTFVWKINSSFKIYKITPASQIEVKCGGHD